MVRARRGPLFSRFIPLGLMLLLTPLAAAFTATAAIAQDSAPLSCTLKPASPATPPAAPESKVAAPASGPKIKVTIGYVKASVFAPMFIAKDRGFFAAQGLDVDLQPLPGGSDMVALTATGKFYAGIGGAGPAFWNALALGLPLKAIAPGHAEGNPVATPLMISKTACESGSIKAVADLKGKKVAVNARGATEYWLFQALGTGGLTLDDVQLQTLAFPDAVAALQAGAIDAAMIGEPLATSAEQKGLAVRLATGFPVQDVQPTIVFANRDFLKKNPAAATGIVTAYLTACRKMMKGGFDDPTDLAIIESYTGVPAALVQAAVRPVYAVDGTFNTEGLKKLQAFFRQRGQLEYDKDLDPASFIDTAYVDAAVAALGPFQP
ncbi:MAG: ABC transporter substrate-binding protein [Thermomicrobiales bacterium]